MPDAVTWDDLKTHCREKRDECKAIRAAETEAYSVTAEGERRTGMSEIEGKLDALRVEVNAIKEKLSDKSIFILPRQILFYLMAGCVGIGFAGEKVLKILSSWFGLG